MTGRHRGESASGKGTRDLSTGEEAQVASEILGREATYEDTGSHMTIFNHQIDYDLDDSYEDQAKNARDTIRRSLKQENIPEDEK